MRGWIGLAALLLALLVAVTAPEASAHSHDTDGLPDDGRIGDAGGDYIIYCKNGFLEVWRSRLGSSRGELVAKFPLGDVRPGDSLHDAVSGVTATRFGDGVQVSGWGNGNNRLGYNLVNLKAADCLGLKRAAEYEFEALVERFSNLGGLALGWREEVEQTPDPLPAWLLQIVQALDQEAQDLLRDLRGFAAANPDWPGAQDRVRVAEEVATHIRRTAQEAVWRQG